MKSCCKAIPATAASGFVLAIAILAGMVVALAYGGLKLALARRGRIWLPHPRWTETAVPVLAVVGLGVAAYLAYVETQAVTAVCGPIGDCNAVQTSEYATLFGIPIGVLGVAGYLTILLTWLWGQ